MHVSQTLEMQLSFIGFTGFIKIKSGGIRHKLTLLRASGN